MKPDQLAAITAIPMELERIYSELQAGMAQFIGTSRLDGARYLPAGGREVAWGGSARLVGWSVRAEGGAVTLRLHNGRDEHGDVVAALEVPAGESRTAWFGGSGVSCPDGLYLERSGDGQLEGAVWIGAVD